MLHHQVHSIQRRDANNPTRMSHPHQMPLRQGPGQQRGQHPHIMMQVPPAPQTAGGHVIVVPQPVVTATPMQQQTPQVNQQAQGSDNETQKTNNNENNEIIQKNIELSNEADDENCSNSGNLTNTKEKTPMCLINELARFNKITHQYRLTSETGPAHKKRFTVTLKLGDEEYTAEGASIKKAQHCAAAEALSSTRYEHPPPKSQKTVLRVRRANITPTVELNALAMKRGEPTSYTFLEHVNSPFPTSYFRGVSYQRFHYTKPMYAPVSVFYVSLKVGDREYSGQGRTAQSAKHDAASKALQELKQLPIPENAGQIPLASPVKENGDVSENGSDVKSPISLVHELALKRNMTVTFEVTKEKGPPHMRTFFTNCKVGDISTEGEGNSKKTSKKRAAELMLEQLKALPVVTPPPNPQRLKRKPIVMKKKTRNLIKVLVTPEPKVKQETADDINPISRLIQIQQSKKEKEPEYTLIEERGLPRRREFVMGVTVGQFTCSGVGPNKKLAKRAAAEALLQAMGVTGPGPKESNIKSEPTAAPEKRKVTFVDEAETKEPTHNNNSNATTTANTNNSQPGGSGGRQLVPGLLLMSDSSNKTGNNTGNNKKNTPNNKKGGGGGSSSPQTAAVIAKELLNSGTSPTADALVASGQLQSSTNAAAVNTTNSPTATDTNVATPKPKDLLNYLSNLLKFTVQYSDFPRNLEVLSLVSLSSPTTLTQVYHGTGATPEIAHDQAARVALQKLSERGFDTAFGADPDNKTKTPEGLLNGSKPTTVIINSKK